MIRSKIAQLLGRSAGGGAKLVVIAYDHAGHYFHELLGYMTAASVLGISLRIIAAKLVDPAIAAQLHSERAIDLLPHTWGIHPPNVVDQLVAFADEQGDLASLWSALDDCDLGSRDMVLFPISRPLIIVRVGAWIARRASRRRPNVLFRFTGGELVDRPTSADSLLNRIGELVDQRQPPAHPTYRVAKAPGQFLQRQSKTLVQLGQQPALFERRLRLGGLHQAGGDQGLGFFPGPATGRDGVSAQPAQGANPLVAIDDHERAVGPLRHDHNGNLLANFGERGQEPPLGFRSHHLQPLVTKRELMKFQFHPGALRPS